ncbi:sarcosine oxidase subunit beta [Enhydrobacter aerosaccus]|uniref:Sarcosine oxidase subunit beta n=1 Tax=Enhydrobacter aerosaccus TaxID=225324 RepID=A0A1T4JJV6_9HYPH|nr:FAD-dependent oxidoreductase [Enhydrobacter aerosaccus]SJZ30444.1 sarcosine oxidase subunit beta [Enhydrobacter aerosaccus]
MKAIIIGGGIMGLATGWALARAGCRVDLFEQGALPNPLSSSFDEHRLIRHPYGDHAGYARMIDDAYAAWDTLWHDLGQRLYAPTGTLALSGNGTDWAQRSAATLAAIGRPMEELAVADLPHRFPMLNTGGVERAFWIDTGGVLFAQDIVTALVQHLGKSRGVTLRAETPVRSVDLDRARIVTGAGAIHDADVVIVAAGAWAGRLMPSLAARLVPSRQIVIYLDMPAEQRAAWAKGPMIIEKTGDVGLYLVPPMEGRGFKVGDHEFSRAGDPDAGRDATEDEIRPLLERCRSLLRGFEQWRTERLKVCFYTVTEDERFVVEKQGTAGWIMSPCSGHGFKFGALMGRELARTIVSERDPGAHTRWAAGLEGDKPS